MERKKASRFISVVKDSEGSWAYRGAAGKKETLGNIESLRKQGVDPRDIDVLPVYETRKDRLGRAFEVICLVATIADLGVGVWKWLKERRKKKESSTTSEKDQ